MTDCHNADIRDQLPDLLHERLDASARAAVLAHVDQCVDCSAELSLLRETRAMLVRTTPRVDVAHIVAALPKPGAAKIVPIASRRRVWTDWRVAAAITLLVAGGSSFALLQRGGTTPAVTLDTLRTPVVGAQPVAQNPVTSTASTSVPATTRVADSQRLAPTSAQRVGSPDQDQTSNADLSPGSRLGGLNATQLKTLLDNIDKLQAVPVTEPEPVTLPVNAQSSSTGNSGDAP